jgi:hypothetical protein
VQTGTVILQAASAGQSRIQLSLSKGSWSEVQSNATPYEGQCSRTGFDGVTQDIAVHNCWKGVVWFLPQIGLQTGAGWADNVASAAAVNTDGSTDVHYFRKPAGTMSAVTANVLARFSAFDLRIDASGLPLVLRFNAHPENDPETDIPTEIRFSDYRVVSGVTVPFHIQKFINNGLVLDLQMSTVQINPPANPA